MPNKPFTRYDIVIFQGNSFDPAAIRIWKWREGWQPGTTPRPDDYEEKPLNYDLDGALAKFAASGYTVRRWNGGARIWKGAPLAVRHEAEIKRLRIKLEREVRENGGTHPRGFQIHTLNLAIDL